MQFFSTDQVRELRVAVDLGVRIFGMDSTGKPFSNPARVVEVSGMGAKLKDVQLALKVDDVIGVQFGTEKSRFRVVWVGEANTPEQGHVGIHSMEPGKCLWIGTVAQTAAVPTLSDLPETKATAVPAKTAGASAAERRRYPRQPCRGKVLMTKAGGNPNTLTLLDISLGGFYAETMSTLPVGTSAAIEITVEDFVVRGEGMVRTAHPAVGNGVAFTKMDEQNWRQLTQLIASLEKPGNSSGDAQSQSIDPAMEALLQLLEARGVLTRTEFLRQLQMVKSRQ